MDDVVAKEKPVSIPKVPWNPLLAVLIVLLVYVAAQFIAFFLVELIAVILQGVHAVSSGWTNSVTGQFIYVAIAEGLTIGGIYAFLKLYKAKLGLIGFKKPRWWEFLIGLAAAPAYYIVYFLTVGVVSRLVPSLNVSEKQNVGFSNVHGLAPLIMTFISLVILPPITEEILVRGFLYSSLRKGLPQLVAVIVTSALFASAHLGEGGGAGLLWIAALDTFVLSLFLIMLRELTGSLWSSITLHAIKNGVAFFALYIFISH